MKYCNVTVKKTKLITHDYTYYFNYIMWYSYTQHNSYLEVNVVEDVGE